MLNRKDLTLSALALSNGLNLGTRSLAANASVIDGDQTLNVRHSHHGVMREGMVWYARFSNRKPRYAIPTIPSSFSIERQRLLSWLPLQQGCVAVSVPVEPDPRPADLVGRPEPCVQSLVFRCLTSGSCIGDTTTTTSSDSRSRSNVKTSGKLGLKRTARRAAKPAAAAMSAASGK
jgi:hypothetical protein